MAQIPNNGFEAWEQDGAFLAPSGWATLNAIAQPGEPMNERVEGYSGAYAMRLTTRAIFGSPVAAAAVSGTFNGEGFAWTTRSAALTGKLRFHAGEVGDAGIITVNMSRRDPDTGIRQYLGAGYLAWDSEAAAWTDFSIPIQYENDFEPDSAIIIISSSDAAIMGVGTQLTLDDLQFAGLALNVPASVAARPGIRVFKTGEDIQVSTANGNLGVLHLRDAHGRTVLEQVANASNTAIPVGHLAPGVYVLVGRGADGRPWVRRVVVP